MESYLGYISIYNNDKSVFYNFTPFGILKNDVIEKLSEDNFNTPLPKKITLAYNNCEDNEFMSITFKKNQFFVYSFDTSSLHKKNNNKNQTVFTTPKSTRLLLQDGSIKHLEETGWYQLVGRSCTHIDKNDKSRILIYHKGLTNKEEEVTAEKKVFLEYKDYKDIYIGPYDVCYDEGKCLIAQESETYVWKGYNKSDCTTIRKSIHLMGISTFTFVMPSKKAKAQYINTITALGQIKLAISPLENYLATSSFLAVEEGDIIRKENENLLLTARRKLEEEELEKTTKYKVYKDEEARKYLDSWNEKSGDFIENIIIHNDKIAQKILDDGYSPIVIDGRTLDNQQMICVLKDTSRNHLVLAGAGTGKTTTIIGKVKHLLDNDYCKPEEILVLAFNKKPAEELSERINKELGDEVGNKVEASTFHSTGYNIIKRCEEKIPNAVGEDEDKFLKEIVKKTLKAKSKDAEYQEKLTDYLLYHGFPAKSDDSFESEDEYNEYLEHNPYTTLQKEKVKSYGEREIANFLYKNGIEYRYEKDYEKCTRTPDFAQYKPDFYLSKSGIYIEYFGIDKNKKVAPFFKCKYGDSASDVYNAAMEWKQHTHEENNTKLVGCFFTEKSSGELLSNLEANLKKNNVVFAPKTTEELYQKLTEHEKLENGFINLACTIINLIKSNNYSYKDVHKLVDQRSTETEKMQNLALIELIEPIYDKYQQTLNECQKIDYNDMINRATRYVTEGKYLHKFKYIIVDEYQDISKSRIELLKVLRKTNDFKLFCVGDDWQSIYEFTGSNIDYITSFDKYWGVSEKSKIETTYRFPRVLADISSNFIMRNPMQEKKNIRSQINDVNFPLIEANHTKERFTETIISRLDELPKNELQKKITVFILARYHDDIRCIDNNNEFSVIRDKKEKETYTVRYNKERDDLEISYHVAHAIKGLEADYIFIINNKNTVKGFPAKIVNAPLIELMIEGKSDNNYSFAEERRLFYVALTRAKKGVFLFTVKDKESVFIKELRKEYESTDKYTKESIVVFPCNITECLETWKERDSSFINLEAKDVNKHLGKIGFISKREGWIPTEKGESIGISKEIYRNEDASSDGEKHYCEYSKKAAEELFEHFRLGLINNEIEFSLFPCGIKKCIEYWKSKDSIFDSFDKIVEGKKAIRANDLLEKEGFIKCCNNENGEGWIPTKKGEGIGILKTENDPEDYVPRCLYTQEAADILFEIFREKLNSEDSVSYHMF